MYHAVFFANPGSNKAPVRDYINRVSDKEKAKIFKYVDYLVDHRGVLDEPYAKHITGKIRELRVGFARNRHRIFFFTFIGRKIVLLHAFLKKTQKTPQIEIRKAQANYQKIINNPNLYESYLSFKKTHGL